MAIDPSTRHTLVAMLRAGYITRAEAALLAGTSRQAVTRWIRGDDLDAIRLAYLDKLFTHFLQLKR